jgi:K+-transporting ATPase A subunit
MVIERRSRRISTLIFLFAIFILLAVFTGAWIYRVYKQQTAYSEARTLATVECGKYYFGIDPKTVSYEDGVLYFEIENTLGADIRTIVVQGVDERREVNISLVQGMIMPVSLQIAVADWVMVYPEGCEGINFKNISFKQAG